VSLDEAEVSAFLSMPLVLPFSMPLDCGGSFGTGTVDDVVEVEAFDVDADCERERDSLSFDDECLRRSEVLLVDR
jgi:hypothetical protein